MKHTITTYFFLLLSAVFYIQCNDNKKSAVKNVSQFNWLNGLWVMKESDGIITEEWKQVNDSLMEGRSDFIKGDSTIPFETIKLFRRGENFYYEAKAAGQNNEQPVAFQLTAITDSSFMAENPKHDFPKRIYYTLINNDSVHATIDGGLALPDKKSEFYYSRVK